MKTRTPALAAIAAAITILSPATQAAPVDFGAYFRAGAGSADQGGGSVCYRLPGSVLWFRLGNECDVYADMVFRSALADVSGTQFGATFRLSYGTQGIANWEQTTPAFREVYAEAKNLGASLNAEWLKGVNLWAGKRFYGNRDIHMLDYGFWEPNQGVGWGLEGFQTRFGRFSYAWLDIGDFTGYGVSPALGGFNPDLIGGGSRTTNVHDFRLENIPANPNGWLTLGLDYAMANNRDGTSSFSRQETKTVWVDDDNDPTTPNVPIQVVVKNDYTIDNKPGKDGFGLHFEHKQDDLFGLGGFNQIVVKYAKDAMTIKGVGIAGSTQPRKEWLVFDQWVIEPKGSPVTAFVTAGYRQQEAQATSGALAGRWLAGDEFWVGARPQYHLNDVWSLMSEIGYQQAKSDEDGLGNRKLAKLTLGTQFSMGRSIWARPSIRFFGTYAKWNDAAAIAGKNTGYGVACTGRDCTTRVNAYDDKRSGFSYGVQVEGWF